MSDSELPRLAEALLGDEPLGELLASDALRARVANALAEIRAGRPTVVWWGKNVDRVDLNVRTDADEWRIVYFTSDGHRVNDLSIFRRPPAFDGVAGGVAVIVNGPSGSGKSSVLEQIAARSTHPWVIFDEPVVGSVDQRYLIWRDQAEVLHRGFIDAIAALARRGNLVAVSAAGHPQQTFEEAFAGVHVIRLGLDCDITTLLAREHQRPGRWGGLAAASVNDHVGWTYDLYLDSVENSPEEIADRVLAIVPNTGGGSGHLRLPAVIRYPDPPLADDRVLLRPWAIGDLACIAEASSDPQIPAGTTVPADFSPEAGRAFIERQWSRVENGEGVSLAIHARDLDRPVGLVFLGLRPQAGVVGLGYWIVPSARGNGYASRAASLMSTWAVGAGGFARVEAWVEPHNVVSQSVLSAAGFELEGRLRSFLTTGSDRADALVYSRLAQ